ncbi:MAG: LamB/YcsF family protein, partial [Deferribacterales bacterium]
LAIANAIKCFNPELYLVGLYNSQLTKAAQDMGLKFLAEGFADRHYDKNGKLVSRSIDGSVIHDLREIKHRVESIIDHGIVKTMEGDTIEIKVDTICVHGDNENALNITKELNRLLKQRR